jgi:dTDP-4-dehydrorhamnose 3,5-epimerase
LIFTETKIRGVFVIELEPITDDRGFFARSFCQTEFARHGLRTSVTQCNVSHNTRRATLRGMHFQIAPKEEAKLVRCTQGRIFDVALDLQPESPSFREWVGVELGSDPQNRRMLYVPEGCAHGFQTLEPDSAVLYWMFGDYSPAHARGVRWDDPAFGIAWPLPDPILSEKDRSYAPFADREVP